MRILQALAAALLLAACSPQPAETPAPAPPPPPAAPAHVSTPLIAVGNPPPMVDGMYVAANVCPGEGCYLKGRIRAHDVADLYDKAGKGAAVTGQVPAREWVEILSTEAHIVPRRGVVSDARGQYAVGDVVFLLTSQGEGCMDAWYKDGMTTWCDPDAGIDPDSPQLDLPDVSPPIDGEGLWVKVKRKQGGEGWVKDVFSAFACTGYQDRDPDCPPLPR